LCRLDANKVLVVHRNVDLGGVSGVALAIPGHLEGHHHALLIHVVGEVDVSEDNRAPRLLWNGLKGVLTNVRAVNMAKFPLGQVEGAHHVMELGAERACRPSKDGAGDHEVLVEELTLWEGLLLVEDGKP